MTECTRVPSSPKKNLTEQRASEPQGETGRTGRTRGRRKGNKEREKEEKGKERGEREEGKKKQEREGKRKEQGERGEGGGGDERGVIWARSSARTWRPRLERSGVRPSGERLRIARAFSLWWVAEMR